MPDRILIVDDERLVLEGWARSLELEGFVVEAAQTPEEALNKCEEHFDLVLLDFLMPRMNGVELLARIRKKLPLIRSVVVSGKLDISADEKQITDDLKATVEADAYLHKPVADEKLVATIRDLLAKEPSHDWQKIAQRVTDARRVTLSQAKEAAAKLKKLRRRGR
jgi:CheY-like chemotaxis protein